AVGCSLMPRKLTRAGLAVWPFSDIEIRSFQFETGRFDSRRGRFSITQFFVHDETGTVLDNSIFRTRKLSYREPSPLAPPLLSVKPEAHAPDHAHGFYEDAARHLGLTGAPVDEHDGDLGDAEAELDRAVGHLDLEAVAIAAHALEIDGGQDLAAEA